MVSSGICARRLWNDTGIDVVENTPYAVHVEVVQPIVDGDHWPMVRPRKLHGWDCPFLWPLCFMKRSPFNPYFALIGLVDYDKPARRIPEYDPADPRHTVFIAPATGRLYCYFNDWQCLYENNHGMVKLTFESLHKL